MKSKSKEVASAAPGPIEMDVVDDDNLSVDEKVISTYVYQLTSPARPWAGVIHS